MIGNRRRDTRPELELRSRLHSLGLRYRVDFRPISTLNRRADIVFTKQRVAVFVHGCFWHGCSQHYVAPKANESYWRSKVEANRARDAHTREELEGAGWLVIEVWEHEALEQAAEQIALTVRGRPVCSRAASCAPMTDHL